MAWAIPVAVAATPTPAFAASTCVGSPNVCASGTMGFGGAVDGNGWQKNVTGAFSPSTVFQYKNPYTAANVASCSGDGCTAVSPGNTTSVANAIYIESNPTGSGRVATYFKTMCLSAGTTYTFTFSWAAYTANCRAAYLDSAILNPDGTIAAAGAQVVAPASTKGNTSGTVTITITPLTTSDAYTFRYTWTFGTTPTSYGGSCNIGANDIGVSAPTVTCRAAA
ncbi:hypothetical protein [Knoellia remsis]|nr:hypothetical protein [Knoellia remsis]